MKALRYVDYRVCALEGRKAIADQAEQIDRSGICACGTWRSEGRPSWPLSVGTPEMPYRAPVWPVRGVVLARRLLRIEAA